MKRLSVLEYLQERDQLSKLNLNEMRYFPRGVDSKTPALQCLSAILLGFIFPLVLAIIIRIVDYLITGV